MEKQNDKPFPYQFKDITPEEKAYIDKIYEPIQCLHRYVRVGPKGYVVFEPYKIDAANIYNMPLRSTDVFVASYQRSGTTWTQELVWLLANNLDYIKAAAIPLVHRYPFLDMFMYFDLNRIDEWVHFTDSKKDEQILENIFKMLGTPVSGSVASMPKTEPRFIKTHLPMSLLNPKLLDTAKMVYVARDPRDVAVSCYHHARLFTMTRFPGGFKDYWNLFYRDLNLLCPIFEHVKEAWEKRHHPNMLFLFYEDLSKDLNTSIKRVADFLGKDLNPEELDRLSDHLNINNFKNNKSVNFEDMREHGLLATDETFVRKGQTGGWRDYFDEEMTLQAEQWIADNLRDTDLRYPNMDIKI